MRIIDLKILKERSKIIKRHKWMILLELNAIL